VDDIDLYIPHQANKRIIDHAARNLGIPEEKIFVNLQKYGNTSSASIPLCLAEAVAAGRLTEGTRVLMTGMGAGLTWGSALLEWTAGPPADQRPKEEGMSASPGVAVAVSREARTSRIAVQACRPKFLHQRPLAAERGA
jgi:hypothetical protein